MAILQIISEELDLEQWNYDPDGNGPKTEQNRNL
jgi:hypothetical protein